MKPIIPDAALQQHIAVLGKTGSGKTSTGKLLVEQVVADDNARVCILDTVKSDWWGLTSSADGKRAGLPFHILGGPRGHVPLHSNAGKAIAEIVASGALRHSIIDMADFEAGGAQRFFVDFAPTLLRHMRGVLYLVIEEAHELAPKERSGFDKENMSIHYAKKLATAGRSKGIRLVVLTQRTQSLHNALLGSCDTLIAQRFTAPADQEPVVKWLKSNLEPGLAKEVAASLSSLKTGEGWLCAGEAKIFERRQFPRIKTYDNSATPTDDAHQHEVKTAPVDPEKLRAIIGEAVKEAEAKDPVKLQALVRRLHDELAKKPGGEIDPKVIDLARRQGDESGYARGRADGYAAGLRAMSPYMERMNTLTAALSEHVDGFHADLTRLTKAAPQGAAPSKPARANPRPGVKAPAADQPRPATPADLTGPQQRILDALAWLEAVGIEDAHRTQLALLAKASPTSSSYGNNLGALRTAKLIEYNAGSRVYLTADGKAAARAPDAPPTTADLHRTLQEELSGPQWRILEQLIRLYPEAMDKTTLADAAGASVSSSSFGNNLGALRSLGFINYPSPGNVVALPVLFLEGR